MQNNSQSKGSLTLYQLVEQTGIGKAHLASKMGMPPGTFNNKLSDKQTAYRFTEDEEAKLKEILRNISAMIKTTCGN